MMENKSNTHLKSKQVIIIRKDLNMRKGKQIAQGAHASMKVILDLMSANIVDNKISLILDMESSSAMSDWLNGIFTKICVSVDSEKELVDIYEKAISLGIPSSLIEDAGLTEFNGVPTKTAVAIGPGWNNEINQITGHLKLL